MTATTSGPSVSSPEGPRPVRRAVRSVDDAYLGGVAAGLADHLGLDVQLVRLAFLVSGALGFGVLFYAALWLVLPLAPTPEDRAPGLASATRQGRRPGHGRPARLRDAGLLVAVAAVALGLAGLVNLSFGGPLLFWPVLVAVVGMVVLWRQADEAQRERWTDGSGRIDVRRILVGGGGLGGWARLAAGIGLLLAALAIFAVQTGDLGAARTMVLAGALGMLGLGLTLGPWLFRLASELADERAARVRTQERADVAAHLHDSVLQTLALIQKNAGDATQVARLARAQERDLRRWMFGETAPAAQTVASALKAAAEEVEDAHGVPVEVVTVGDTTVSEELQPLLAAAREAVSNAARHSGAVKVDVYAEVGAGAVEVFVRDRGAGFDLAQVPLDRLGVRGSILARMERHGGTAEVRSTPGQGTEVTLCMPRAAMVQPGEENR